MQKSTVSDEYTVALNLIQVWIKATRQTFIHPRKLPILITTTLGKIWHVTVEGVREGSKSLTQVNGTYRPVQFL